MTRQDDTSDTGAEMARPATLQFDPARYRAELDLFDITEEQKHELLTTLWSIMRSFVEIGFAADVCAAVMQEFTPMPDGGTSRPDSRSALDHGDL